MVYVQFHGIYRCGCGEHGVSGGFPPLYATEQGVPDRCDKHDAPLRSIADVETPISASGLPQEVAA